MLSEFEEGPPYAPSATFLDETGALVDYPTVEFSYMIMRSGQTEQTLTYSAGGSGYGVIIRASTGVYYCKLQTSGLAGKWKLGWRGLDVDGVTELAKMRADIVIKADTSGLF